MIKPCLSFCIHIGTVILLAVSSGYTQKPWYAIHISNTNFLDPEPWHTSPGFVLSLFLPIKRFGEAIQVHLDQASIAPNKTEPFVLEEDIPEMNANKGDEYLLWNALLGPTETEKDSLTVQISGSLGQTMVRFVLWKDFSLREHNGLTEFRKEDTLLFVNQKDCSQSTILMTHQYGHKQWVFEGSSNSSIDTLTGLEVVNALVQNDAFTGVQGLAFSLGCRSIIDSVEYVVIRPDAEPSQPNETDLMMKVHLDSLLTVSPFLRKGHRKMQMRKRSFRVNGKDASLKVCSGASCLEFPPIR